MTTPSPREEIPQVPDHEILRRIGRGSYGEVWLARNLAGSFRAIKIARQDSFESGRPYAREFEGLKKFEPVSRGHPGLVGILHIGRNERAGSFYCVMEPADDIVAGPAIDPAGYRPKTLASEIVRRSRLPAGECAMIGERLAEALGYLHSRGLVHRDVKPSNIIFIDGLPKLADIGLVTGIGAGATRVGTEGYMPPEGPGSPVADTYALGRVLYEMAFGKSQEEFPELPTGLRALPEAPALMRLNSIILKACAREPSGRFRLAGEMRDALAELRRDLDRVVQTAPPKAGWPAGGVRIVIIAVEDIQENANLARAVARQLTDEGLNVFMDAEAEISLERARRLEREIRAADAIIPFLSPASARNEMMAYALELASQARARTGRKPRLLPVSGQSSEGLPRQAAAALEGADIAVIDAGSSPDQRAELVVARLKSALGPA
jgi:serine/threonine protein kinase